MGSWCCCLRARHLRRWRTVLRASHPSVFCSWFPRIRLVCLYLNIVWGMCYQLSFSPHGSCLFFADQTPLPAKINFPDLLGHFEKLQQKHAEYLRKSRIQAEQQGVTQPSSLPNSDSDRTDVIGLSQSSSVQMIPDLRNSGVSRAAQSPTIPIRRLGASEPANPTL